MGQSLFKCCHGEDGPSVRLHLDEQLGKSTARLWSELVEGTLDTFRNELSGGRSLTHPPLVNLGMILKNIREDDRYARPPTSGRSFQDRGVMSAAARYARYAAAAYYSDKLAIVRHVGDGLEVEDIKHVHVSTNPSAPNFYVAVQPQAKEIVLAVRGAGSGADAIGRFSAETETWESWMGGRANAWSLESARRLQESCTPILTFLTGMHSDKNVTFTGHGWGAAAAIFAAMLIVSVEDSILAKAKASGKLRVFAFGPPPMFAPLSALPSWVQASTYSFVHGVDCVPRTCLGTVCKLIMALQEVDALPLKLEERLAILRGEEDLDQELPDHVALPAKMQDKLGSLFVPGHIVLVYRGTVATFSELVSADVLDRLLMHPAMLEDHRVAAYEEALSDAVVDMRSHGKGYMSCYSCQTFRRKR